MAQAPRQQSGLLRRILFGFTLQLLISAAVHPHLQPCFPAANTCFAALVVGRLKKPAWGVALLAAAVLLPLDAVRIGQHDIVDVVLSLVLGWMAYYVSFSKELDFLDNPDLWAAVQFELQELWTLLVSNRRAHWESTYTAGQWDSLQSLDQRPRYYIIAAIIRDRFPHGVDVLDVGCGYGVLYPLLGKSLSSYTGIDWAEVAITKCRSMFAGDPCCSFRTLAFEEYSSDKRFDVVVLNEVLYYFPLASIESIFDCALKFLKNDQSVLIISLCRNFKARLVGHKLSRVATPKQCIRVHNVLTGSYWTISVYRKGCCLRRNHDG